MHLMKRLLIFIALACFYPLATQAAGTTVESRVAASSDDAEERSAGSMSLTSTDLELTYDGVTQKIGMRFNGLAIPPGATIVSAYIQFQAKEAQSEATSLTIVARPRGSMSIAPCRFRGNRQLSTCRFR